MVVALDRGWLVLRYVLLLQLMVPVAHSGNGSDRGGGDTYAFEFKGAARDLLKRLAMTAIQGLDLDSLARMIESSEVYTVKVACRLPVSREEDCPRLERRDAINFPSEEIILLARSSWMAIRQSRTAMDRLVLHEYFSLLRLERDEDTVSAMVLEAMYSPDSQSTVVIPVMDMINATDPTGDCLNRCDESAAEAFNLCQRLGTKRGQETCLKALQLNELIESEACYARCDQDPNWIPPKHKIKLVHSVAGQIF